MYIFRTCKLTQELATHIDVGEGEWGACGGNNVMRTWCRVARHNKCTIKLIVYLADASNDIIDSQLNSKDNDDNDDDDD